MKTFSFVTLALALSIRDNRNSQNILYYFVVSGYKLEAVGRPIGRRVYQRKPPAARHNNANVNVFILPPNRIYFSIPLFRVCLFIYFISRYLYLSEFAVEINLDSELLIR